ncbi:MAG: hypothetical protein IJX45_00770 [Spirochaetaceae bacterium]|nr:hypothetical protein [Spirochaetaceae bacterium]
MEVIETAAPAACESVCKKIQTFPRKNALSLPIYEPHSYIDPDNRHPYDDKTKKIFYNVSRYQAVEDPEVKDFLRYLENTPPTNDFTRRLDQMVEELKTIEMGFSDYIAARQKEFDWLRQGKEQGFEAGRQQGAYQKALETARNLLARKLPVDLVVDCTKLPLETVQQLASETTK